MPIVSDSLVLGQGPGNCIPANTTGNSHAHGPQFTHKKTNTGQGAPQFPHLKTHMLMPTFFGFL